MIGRRGFITGLVSLVAAPAIVRAGSLMPVKVMVDPVYGVGPVGSALTGQYLLNLERALRAMQLDMACFGSGAIFVGNDGQVRHIAVGELYR